MVTAALGDDIKIVSVIDTSGTGETELLTRNTGTFTKTYLKWIDYPLHENCLAVSTFVTLPKIGSLDYVLVQLMSYILVHMNNSI